LIESRGKRRTREHIIADLSVNYVQRLALSQGHTVQARQADYGIDLQMDTFDEEGLVEPGCVYFQLKATDSLALDAKGQFISQSLDIRDLRLWLREIFPVVLVVYDASRSVAYWMNVQEHFRENPPKVGQKTSTVRIPVANILEEVTIRELRTRKNVLIEQIIGSS
jgi:hypothetical protein